MVFDRADASAAGDPDRHGQADTAPRPVVHLGQLGDDLIEGGVDETVELDLAYRPEPAHRQPDRRPDDRGFRERGVDHPFLAEVGQQPVGDAEDPAEPADVLAHHDDSRIVIHGRAQPRVEGLGQGQRRRPGRGDPRVRRGHSTLLAWGGRGTLLARRGRGVLLARHGHSALPVPRAVATVTVGTGRTTVARPPAPARAAAGGPPGRAARWAVPAGRDGPFRGTGSLQ